MKRTNRKKQQTKPRRQPQPCRHCGNVRASRPRGLCWTCYHKPEVLERYGKKFDPDGDFYGGYELDDQPCFAPPAVIAPGEDGELMAVANPKKIEVFQRRIAAQRALHHPGDEGYRGVR